MWLRSAADAIKHERGHSAEGWPLIARFVLVFIFLWHQAHLPVELAELLLHVFIFLVILQLALCIRRTAHSPIDRAQAKVRYCAGWIQLDGILQQWQGLIGLIHGHQRFRRTGWRLRPLCTHSPLPAVHWELSNSAFQPVQNGAREASDRS